MEDGFCCDCGMCEMVCFYLCGKWRIDWVLQLLLHWLVTKMGWCDFACVDWNLVTWYKRLQNSKVMSGDMPQKYGGTAVWIR